MDPGISRRDLLKTAAGAVGAAALADAGEAAAALPRRPLGNTGVQVPILGFGTAPSGIRRNLKNALELYNEAINLGVTYFDTAPLHTGYGKAQEQLGHLFKDRRKEVFLVTKCHESNGEEALRLLQRNLKEMKTDRADLVHAHSLGSMDLNAALGKNGVLAALMKAKRDGLIRFVGISGHHRPARFLRALEAYDVDVIMCAVNFADRYTYGFEEKIWPVAAKKGVGLVAMKVFGGMVYSDQGMSNTRMPRQHLPLAFRYALSVPRVATAVIGMSTLEELRRNVAWARQFKPLTQQERAALAPLGRRIAAKWGPHHGPVT